MPCPGCPAIIAIMPAPTHGSKFGDRSSGDRACRFPKYRLAGSRGRRSCRVRHFCRIPCLYRCSTPQCRACHEICWGNDEQSRQVGSLKRATTCSTTHGLGQPGPLDSPTQQECWLHQDLQRAMFGRVAVSIGSMAASRPPTQNRKKKGAKISLRPSAQFLKIRRKSLRRSGPID